MVPVFQEGAL